MLYYAVSVPHQEGDDPLDISPVTEKRFIEGKEIAPEETRSVIESFLNGEAALRLARKLHAEGRRPVRITIGNEGE